MIILGIDPGTSRIGWAVLKTQKRNILPLGYGCWQLQEKEQEKRLLRISKNLTQTIKQYHPDYVALEKVFFFKNAKTVMSISEATGVIALVTQKQKLPCLRLTPLEIKQNLIGYGRAEKKDVQKLVQLIFSLKEIPKPDDTADALAVALAGLNKIQNGHFQKNN
ncbi:MAG: crossover junction endodeoxyribonuclease RuvC [Patescibacteria group bacterium]|nr:crossover junction endodeoxyribonuclease RuvC [Patescibacteria group bacterium]